MQSARVRLRRWVLASVAVLALSFLVSHHAGTASPQHGGHSPSVEHMATAILEFGADNTLAVFQKRQRARAAKDAQIRLDCNRVVQQSPRALDVEGHA